MHELLFINLLGSYNVMKLLGYTPNDERTGINDLPSGEPGLYKYFEGNKKAQFNNIQNVLVLASFVNGSYYNNQAKNVLASVTPDCDAYSTILYRPNKRLYIPVTQNVLDTITFQLVDQDFKEVNLGVNNEFDVPERWSMRIIIVPEELIE